MDMDSVTKSHHVFVIFGKKHRCLARSLAVPFLYFFVGRLAGGSLSFCTDFCGQVLR